MPIDIAAVRRDPMWVLLPLRLFLGVTFLYAGLSKIADRRFLDAAAPTGMHATTLAVKNSSPIGGLLQPVIDHSFAFGLLMALAEVAVGIGVLFGLFARIAALGGLALSLSLFLTVSWNADPWYTGADLVYALALTPLLLAGRTPLSVDEWMASLEARPGADLSPAAGRTRRAALAGVGAVAGLVAVGVASLTRGRGGSAAAARTGGSAPAGPALGGGGASGGGAATGGSVGSASAATLVAAAQVPVGGAVRATDPTSGAALWVLQLQAGRFTALDSTCPHQGCAVNFVSAGDGFACPCHNSTFDPSGAVTNGPATRNLTPVAVKDVSGKITRG